MNCEFIEKDPADPVRKPCDIVLDGKVYGEIKPSKGSPWHASFLAVAGGYGSALLQGFGDTPEEAFHNAFLRTRLELERHLAEVEECRRLMLGDEE